MLLAEAATLSRRLKESNTRWRRETQSRSDAFKISIKALKDRLSERAEVIEDVIDILYPKYSKYLKIMSGINVNIKPPIKNKNVKPNQIPKKCRIEAFLPNFLRVNSPATKPIR